MRARVFIPTFVVGASLTTACFIPGFTKGDSGGTGGTNTGGNGTGANGGEGGGACTPDDLSAAVVLEATQGGSGKFTLPSGLTFVDGTFTTAKGYAATVSAGVLTLAELPGDQFGWDSVELRVDDGCAEVAKSVELRISPAAGGPLELAADGIISGWSGPLSLGAADFNGDGKLDLIVGERDGAAGNGLVQVLFGGSALISGRKELTDLASEKLPGFVITGPTGASLGASVSTAGDVNCSERDAIVLGAPSTGQAFVVFGEENPEPLDLGTASARAFAFTGLVSGGTGTDLSLSGGQDANGDGVSDFVVGIPNYNAGASNAGLATVVFGGFQGCGCAGAGTCLTSGQDLTAIGSGGYRITNAGSANRLVGRRVAMVGDVTGDGSADLTVTRQNPRLDFVPGQSATTDIDLGINSDFVTGDGASSVAYSAAPASGLDASDSADFDGDEAPDYAYCIATTGGSAENICTVVRGDSSPIDVSGFAGTAPITLGVSVAYLGATNGDARADLLFAEGEFAWVVFGSTSGAALDVTSLGSRGYALAGEAGASLTAIGLGDLDGDGFTDFAVADAGSGQIYVVRGGP